MMGDESHLFYGGGFMWIFWVVIIVGIVLLIQMMTKNKSKTSSSQNESPLEILKKCYARGEIDEDEFLQRRKELKN